MTDGQKVAILEENISKIEEPKEMYRMRKFLIYMSYFTLVITAGFVSYLFYITFYPFHIVDLKDFTVAKKTVRRGTNVEYVLAFDKKLDYTPKVEYYLVDGFVYKFDDDTEARPVGDQKVNKTKLIPDETPVGIYKLRIELDYVVAPWRHIKYTWESNQFVVE